MFLARVTLERNVIPRTVKPWKHCFGRLLVTMTGMKWSFFLYFGIEAGCPDFAITFHFIQCSPGIGRRVINIHLNLTDFEENKPTHALLSDFLQANNSGRWWLGCEAPETDTTPDIPRTWSECLSELCALLRSELCSLKNYLPSALLRWSRINQFSPGVFLALSGTLKNNGRLRNFWDTRLLCFLSLEVTGGR